MNLTPEHRAVLTIVRRQYPGSLTAQSIAQALSEWNLKERRVNNLLNDLCKAGLVKNEKSNGAARYISTGKPVAA